MEREEQERRRRKKEDKERKKELKQAGGGGTPSKMARLEQQLKQEPADQANNKSNRPSGLQVVPVTALYRYCVIDTYLCGFFSHYFPFFPVASDFYRHL